MPTPHVNDLLDKLNELRALFVLGQRAVPFLEETFTFLKEISPLFDEINQSIRESTHKMPHAKSQLESVSQATELATTEILDLIDGVLAEVEQIKAGAEQSAAQVEAIADVDTLMLGLMREHVADAEALERLEALHAEKAALRENLTYFFTEDVALVNEIRNKANRIMMSLQVQDITAQQIAAANHLIESVRERLAELVLRLTQDVDEDLSLVAPPSSDAPNQRLTFDSNARYDHSGTRQQLADDLVAAFQSGDEVEAVPSEGPVSADDIDGLFGGATPADKPATPPSRPNRAPASQSDIDDLFGSATPADSPAAGPASQSDIDDLFGGGNSTASQSDIDDLFGDGGSGPASQSDIDDLFGSFEPKSDRDA